MQNVYDKEQLHVDIKRILDVNGEKKQWGFFTVQTFTSPDRSLNITDTYLDILVNGSNIFSEEHTFFTNKAPGKQILEIIVAIEETEN